MPFADDLLALARLLSDLDEAVYGQAGLRRAVLTAYYAMFHLLVAETTLN